MLLILTTENIIRLCKYLDQTACTYKFQFVSLEMLSVFCLVQSKGSVTVRFSINCFQCVRLEGTFRFKFQNVNVTLRHLIDANLD